VYRIGQFSKIGKVTVKALRFYEEEGLLEPSRIDPATGYRYYDSRLIGRVHKIVALKQCGFSIPEIRQLVYGKNVAALFAERRRRLEGEVREASLQLSSIESYIESIRENGDMKYEIVVKDLPRVIVYSKRLVVESYDSYFDLIPKIGEELVASNPGVWCVLDPPYCFIIYHDGEYKERDIDIEFCEAVNHAGVDTETIKFKTIERVPAAACVMHRGPYSTLRSAYAAVFKWIDDNGYIPADNPRESYIDGIWNRDDPAEWLTEVQVPIDRGPS
jgi:DNA-binding transcriptional MerR regulator/effector-binding domain-containing protein